MKDLISSTGAGRDARPYRRLQLESQFQAELEPARIKSGIETERLSRRAILIAFEPEGAAVVIGRCRVRADNIEDRCEIRMVEEIQRFNIEFQFYRIVRFEAEGFRHPRVHAIELRSE